MFLAAAADQAFNTLDGQCTATTCRGNSGHVIEAGPAEAAAALWMNSAQATGLVKN
jgi:hypothetical protein